ncbi:MAG: arginine synthesis PII-interacting regulator PirA [Brasilonema sp.]
MARNRVEVITKARKVQQLNIIRSLEHRLEVARARGDESLIRQLEAEMKYFS